MHPYLQIAIKAALEAGKEILAVYDTDFSVQLKEDHSPLTLADERSNRVINKHLEATKIPIISEENKQIAFNDRKDWEKCWIVDPLDGTKEFVKRNGEFTVNIALVERGTPVLGVIYVPVIETLYYGTKDLGKSFKAIVDQPNIDVVSSKAEAIHPANLQEPYKIVGSRSHLNEDTQNFIKKIEKQHPVELVSKGSSLKFCLVAEGLAHIYPRFAPTMEWDTAAGQAICEAVGISVIDQQTQKPLRYNKENLLNPHFLVTLP